MRAGKKTCVTSVIIVVFAMIFDALVINYFVNLVNEDKDTNEKNKVNNYSLYTSTNSNNYNRYKYNNNFESATYPQKGMTKDDVVNVWGKPNQAALDNPSSGYRYDKDGEEMFLYERGNNKVYIFFTNGYVSKFMVNSKGDWTAREVSSLSAY